jgi:hypothetical protein
MMKLYEVLQDIHALQEDLLMYERKYGILSTTFYDSYMQGDEPADDAWVLDWNDWAGAYEIWLERQQQYNTLIQSLQKSLPLAQVIEKAAKREPISVAA